MAAPKVVRKAGGAIPSAADTVAAQYDPPFVPLDLGTVWQALLQLQNTVNALEALFNSHTHSGVTVGAGATGTPSAPITNTNINAQTAQNLFTTT